MNRDDIIRMAREAGIVWNDHTVVGSSENLLERFATLVYEHTWKDAALAATRTVVDAAVLAEREACAKVCDLEFAACWHADALSQAKEAKRCAAAIRARGEQ